MSEERGGLEKLLEEAQRWEEILKPGSPTDLAEFSAWIRRSPEHLEAYLLHCAVTSELQQLDVHKELDIERLLGQATSNVVQLQTGVAYSGDQPISGAQPIVEPRQRQPWWAYAAAVAAISLATLLYLAKVGGWTTATEYQTTTGEQRRIPLADGSVIELNTQSHIRVSLSRRSRKVELLSGEALFSVEHDANRPFRVYARGTIVEDLGTRFAVYMHPDDSTTVSVLEGRVEVSSAAAFPAAPPAAGGGVTARSTPADSNQVVESGNTLEVSTGERADVSAGGHVLKHAHTNLKDTLAWREHRLWFENASLQQVASEFNRYNNLKIDVAADSGLDKKRYTATFDAYDPQSFVEALRADPMLSIHTSGNSVLIEPAR